MIAHVKGWKHCFKYLVRSCVFFSSFLFLSFINFKRHGDGNKMEMISHLQEKLKIIGQKLPFDCQSREIGEK